MNKMLFINDNTEIAGDVDSLVGQFSDSFSIEHRNEAAKALEYIKYDFPEIIIMNLVDTSLDPSVIIEETRKDTWLHTGGFIIIHDQMNLPKLYEQLKGVNIIAYIHITNFKNNFKRTIRILEHNSQIIFQRDLQKSLLHSVSGNYTIENDPFDARVIANLLPNYLFNLNYINDDLRDRLNVAIFEMLMNAIEHGNCSISHDEKTAFLESGGDIFDLIREKQKDPVVCRRKVHFSYKITPSQSSFIIADEGNGFDWKKYTEPDNSVVLALHGHGIKMTNHYIKQLTYNDAGNEVSFTLDHRVDDASTVPELFLNREEALFSAGEVVFHENENSTNLYYIVKGDFDVISEGKSVSRITSNDIFLGEMSFLLGNKRSATIIANTESVLLKITKKEFIDAIQKFPHYGIFLARLIAKRLEKQNKRVVDLSI